MFITKTEKNPMLETPCIVCGGKYEKSNIPGLMKCKKCGFTTVAVDVPEDTLVRLYDINYFNGVDYHSYEGEKESSVINFKNYLIHLMRILNQDRNKSIFEIGCAYGYFLDTVRGFFKNIEGVDISNYAVSKAKELNIDAICDDFLHIEFKQKFDVFCMWETLAHVKYPEKYLAKISENIAPNGYVALTLSDIESNLARLSGSHWRMITPPYRLHYFSQKTITQFLNRCGYDVVSLEYISKNYSWREMSYQILTTSFKHNDWYKKIENSNILNNRSSINFGDYMIVIAKKK